jgi:hypothetical protein
VTMMFTGGQRSLTAAASLRPFIEPRRSMSVKTVRMSLRVSRTLNRLAGVCHSYDVVTLVFQLLADVQTEHKFVFDNKNTCQSAAPCSFKRI